MNRAIRFYLERQQRLHEMLAEISFSGCEAGLEEILVASLAEEYCKQNSIEISENEIVRALNQIRKSHRLFTAEQTSNWLHDKGLTDDELRQWARKTAMVHHLEDAIADDAAIERYFSLNKLKFDQAELYKIVLKSYETAAEIRAQVLEGESFFDMARTYSCEQSTRASCGYIGKVRREKMPAELECQVFSNEPKQIIGPIKFGTEYHLYRLESVSRAVLTDSIRDQIIEILMKQWLAEKIEELEAIAVSNDEDFSVQDPLIIGVVSDR